MGLDYSYKLFFNQAQLWDVLAAVASLARAFPNEQTTIQFSDHELTLPFALLPNKSCNLAHDDSLHRRHFTISLYFEFDEAIERYSNDWRNDVRTSAGFEEWELPLDAQGRVAIGNIYLTVYRDLNYTSRKDYDPCLVMLCFTAATTEMSRLFEKSQSIRDTFTLLVLLNHGEYCLLDRENDAVVLCWKGEVMQRTIPDGWLPQRELEIMFTESVGP